MTEWDLDIEGNLFPKNMILVFADRATIQKSTLFIWLHDYLLKYWNQHSYLFSSLFVPATQFFLNVDFMLARNVMLCELFSYF